MVADRPAGGRDQADTVGIDDQRVAVVQPVGVDREIQDLARPHDLAGTGVFRDAVEACLRDERVAVGETLAALGIEPVVSGFWVT